MFKECELFLEEFEFLDLKFYKKFRNFEYSREVLELSLIISSFI